MPVSAIRLLNIPIIHAAMDQRIGSNINGPSLMRMPNWVKHPLGKYYLYFAHHRGKYIRMAFADDLLGPWQTHKPGVLGLENSYFQIQDIDEYSDQLRGTDLYAHIASPDVHVDKENQRIFMYYHGMLADADQQTRIAYSEDGLNFKAQSNLLGPAYFRTLKYENWIYVITWAGYLLRSRSWDGPFEKGGMIKNITSLNNPNRILRHTALLLRKNILHIFFSCIGDEPESICHASINLNKKWEDWQLEEESIILKPELEWEGANLPVKKSLVGAADYPVHELRDPCIYQEDENIYLLYCGAGESGGIGIAKVELEVE